MFIIEKKTLFIQKETSTKYINTKGQNIDIESLFNNSNKTIPDRLIHNKSIRYIQKFNQIITKCTFNYKTMDSRDEEYLFLELIDFWDKFLTEKKIKKVIFENIDICPFTFTLFTLLKISEKKIIFSKYKFKKTILKNRNYKYSLNKFFFIKNIIFDFLIKIYSLSEKDQTLYKYQRGSLKKISKTKKMINLILNLFLKIKIIYLIKFNTISEKKMINIDVVKYNYINWLFYEENFSNIMQKIELTKDLYADNNICVNLYLSELLKCNNLEILDVKTITYITKNKIKICII